jgi:hypothetical protein
MNKILANSNLKNVMVSGIALLILCSLAVAGRARVSNAEKLKVDIAGVTKISPAGHQPLRADIINGRASRFTVDTDNLANILFSDTSPTYVMFVQSTLPSECADFTNINVDYVATSKTRRRYNFEANPEIAQSIKTIGCAVLKNAKAPLPEPELKPDDIEPAAANDTPAAAAP